MDSPTVDECQYGIMHVIRNSFLSQNYHYSNYWDVADVETVRNSDLEEQFQEKRRDLIHIGRTKDELTERLLMGCYTKDEDIKFISLNGLQCGKHGTTSYLGNGTKGVTLGKHADILLKSFYNDGYEQCWIVVYKVVCGRQKEVLHIQTPPYREPMQDADCHVSLLAPVTTEDCLLIQDIKAQVFMFDKDENGDFLRRPRQCVPIACVKFKRASPIGTEMTAANQTISEISISGNTKDSFTLLKDSLAKMKESFVLLSKETVINSKTNHTIHPSASKVPVSTSGHRHFQQPSTEQSKRTNRNETHNKDELDKRKSTVSVKTESFNDVDLSSDSATDVEPSDVELTITASSMKCVKKVSHAQRKISKDRKSKLASVNPSTSEERSIALSTPFKVTSGIAGETEKTDSSLTKKRVQLPEPAPRSVVKESHIARAPSAEASSQAHRSDGKCLSRTGVPTGSVANAGKEITSRTDRKHQDVGSIFMPFASNRKTRLIDALPVSSLSSSPSMTSAYSRRPSMVASPNELPKPTKSILRNPITTVQNGSPVATLTSSASGSQTCSNNSSRLTTTTSVRQKQPNCDSEAPPKNISGLVAPKSAKNSCQTSANSAYKPKEKMTLNFNCNAQNNRPTPGDEGRPLFHIPTSSPLDAKTVSIISTSCSTSTVESKAKTTLKSCLTTSVHSTNSASVSRSKTSSSHHKEPTSNFLSQSKPSVTVQTSGASETQPTQTPLTCTTPVNHSSLHLLLQDKISQKAHTNSTTLVPSKTHNDPVSFVQNQIKSTSVKRTYISPKTGTEIVSLNLPSVATTQNHPSSVKPSNQPRTITQSKTIKSTKTEHKSKFQSQAAPPSLNGNFTSTCSTFEANGASCLPQNTSQTTALKESGVQPILKSAPDNCLAKDSDRSKCKTNVTDIQPEAPIVAIPQKKLLLLQHGFISSITKQLASDLNDVANLLRSSKPEKANQREKQALLSLREINSKFTELTPICVQYKQLFRHLKEDQPLRLPELTQLYRQEDTMNECCNVLGKVFSELKTSQLKSETVLQKRSLAIAWLVDSKSELTACINNIKSIVENVVLTCELRSIPSTKSIPSTPEAHCAGNKLETLQTGKDLESKESSAATRDVVKDKLLSPVRCQDLGQVTEAMATERSSQQDRTPKIHVTTETKGQRLPETNETAATVSNIDHLVNFDRGHSEYEEGSGSIPQNAEVTLNLGNGFGDAANEPDKDRETTHLQNETSNSNDTIIEEYGEQEGKGGEPNASECPPIPAVEKSSQAEEEKRAEREKSRSSADSTDRVSRNSSQSSSESNSDGGALIPSEGGIISAEHPSIPAAVGVNNPTNVPQMIKTERSDPPNLIARPPQTIILDADDFFPPSSPSPGGGGKTSSNVESVSKGRKSVNNNDSPSMDFCCDGDSRSTVCLLEGTLKRDGNRYESCVSLESKSSTFSLDSLDDIPPLLTPDSAFDYSSIVYNVKSDEPPILEANTDEPSRNTRHVKSTFGETPRDSPTLVAIPRASPTLVAIPRASPTLVVTPRASPTLVVTPRASPTLVVTPRASPTLAVTQRDSPALVVTPRHFSTLDVPPSNSSNDASDLVLLISGTRTSTIIMNSDDMVACDSLPSERKIRADDEAALGIDTIVCENIKPQIEQDVPTDIPIKMALEDDVQFAVVKETDEENEKSEGNYYVRVVGELTHVDAMAFENDTNAQSSMNCQHQSKGNPMTRFMPDSLQPDHDDSKENTCSISDTSYSQTVIMSDQLDDLPKPVLEVYLKPSPSQSSTNHEFSTTDPSTTNLNSNQTQPKSDQTLIEMASLYSSAPHYREAYAAIIGGVRICGSNQSHYVFKIEPDDDYDPDPVCSYDSLNTAPRQPSASTSQVLLEVSTSRDDQVSLQVCELDSSKPGDAINLLDRNIAQESQVSSNSSTEPLETVVCKSPCLALIQAVESPSTSKPRSYESDNLNSEQHKTVSESQSGQELVSEISTVSNEPVTHISQTVVLPLRLSSSESVPAEVPGVSTESQEVDSSREVERLSVSRQMPQRNSSPVFRESSSSRHTSSDDRCFSPPTVYTEPPQSPPPENLPLTAVIKQEITDDYLDSLVEMKRFLDPRTCRKRKRENKQNQEKPIVVISDEGDELGCSAPPQKQRCVDWSVQSSSQGADRELRDSIARVVALCSSDAHVSASGKPFRPNAKRGLADRHHIDAVTGTEAAAALVEDKLMDGRDGIKPKTVSLCLSSLPNKRSVEDDGKTNNERGFRIEEKRRSRRRSGSRNLSYDRESVSSGSRCGWSQSRDTRPEKHTERRTSRDDSARRKTTCRSPDDQKEWLSTRLSSGSHESLRERRYKDEESKPSPINGRSLNEERSKTRRPNIDVTPRERCRRSEERRDYRSRSYKRSPAECEDQKMRSRSTRPTEASRPLDTRSYNTRKDLPDGGHLDHSCRTLIDPSTLKRQFWSKSHPRFRCNDECDHACATAPPLPQDSDKRHRCGAGSGSGRADTVQRAGNSSPIHDLDILEETLKLNLEMLESSSRNDGEMESPRDGKTLPVRRGGSKRPLLPSIDGIAKRRRKNDVDDKDYEAEAKEEEMDDYQSTTSSRRSKTLSRHDKNSDCEVDRVSCTGQPRTNYGEVDVTDRYSLKKMTQLVSTDDTERGSLLPSMGSTSSSGASGSGSDGRISREFGDDDLQSLKGISTILVSKSTLHTTCRQLSASVSSTSNPSPCASAAPVNLSRTSVTYVTEILQTSNFSTEVCFGKYKKIVN